MGACAHRVQRVRVHMLLFSNVHVLHVLAPLQCACVCEPSTNNHACTQVGMLLQKFVTLREDCSSLKPVYNALGLLTQQWPGSFARCGLFDH